MPKTARGLRASSLNALRYGCEINDFLPCKRWDCVFFEGCGTDPYIRKHGAPPYGEPCSLEKREYDAYIPWARRLYGQALEWLDEDEFEATIQRLAMLQLRRRRILARLNAEGIVQYTTLSNGVVVSREPISSRRYLASLQRERDQLLERLDPDPQTTAERKRRAEEAESRDQRLFLEPFVGHEASVQAPEGTTP